MKENEDSLTLLKSMVMDAVLIDFEQDPIYGTDQVFLCFPVTFPTVTFPLMATPELEHMMDRIRAEQGETTMYYVYNRQTNALEVNVDSGIQYDFFIGINGFSGVLLDSAITAVLRTDTEETVYHLSLTDYEQDVIEVELNEQCLANLDEGLEGLMREARNRMRADKINEK